MGNQASRRKAARITGLIVASIVGVEVLNQMFRLTWEPSDAMKWHIHDFSQSLVKVLLVLLVSRFMNKAGTITMAATGFMFLFFSFEAIAHLLDWIGGDLAHTVLLNYAFVIAALFVTGWMIYKKVTWKLDSRSQKG